MITIKAEQEHCCLVTGGGYWTVVERSAGKYCPLGNRSRHGVDLDAAEAIALFHAGHRYSERAARGILAKVATEWHDMFERIRRATAPAKPEWLVEGYLQSRRRSPASRAVKDGDMPCAAICWS
jgi:hypothetical protein